MLRIKRSGEETIVDAYFFRSRSRIIVMMATGIILYTLFAIVDAYSTIVHLDKILILRLVICAPALSILTVFQLGSSSIHRMKVVNFLYVLVAGISIVFMIGLVDIGSLAYYTYFGGLILVVVWCHAMFLPPPYSTFASFIVLVSYDLILVDRGVLQTDLKFFLVSNSFLYSSFFIAWFSGNTLTRQIIKYDKKRNEIDSLNLELRNLADTRSKLFSILSHDIRGPVSNLCSLINLKSNYGMTDLEYLKYEKAIGQSINNIVDILDTTNGWSKHVQIDGALPQNNFSLKDQVDIVRGYYSITAEMKEIQLVNEVGDCTVQGCQQIIEMSIRNLVSNAIKFTSTGQIVLKSECDYGSNTCRLMVIDTGTGMDEVMMISLNSGSNSVNSTNGTKNEKGFGLGIALCSDMLSKIGGSITYSRNVSKGITATLQFPIVG